MTVRRVVVLAWKSLWLHRLRSLLTVLGIVFGVASVVAMLAVGEGASQAAQDRIRRLGSTNILLASQSPPASDDVSQGRQRVLEFGLLRADVERIRDSVPDVRYVVPRRQTTEEARYRNRKFRATVVGTTPEYATVAMLTPARGRFLSHSDTQEKLGVCVIGSEVGTRLFGLLDPVGRRLWAGREAYRIIGVLAPRGQSDGAPVDTALFIPMRTMEERYGEILNESSSGNFSLQRVQVHGIVVQATSSSAVPRVAAAVRAIVSRWHPDDDVRLTVPLELLKEARETQRLFNIVLGAIAAISLLVGGIGIMNIMLANVMERTREVGIRRALGARRRHIVFQFLAETVVLSVGGGLLGLLLGIALPLAIARFFDVTTVIEPYSLILAFGISAAVGVLFGLYPAARAADLDPVEALRRE